MSIQTFAFVHTDDPETVIFEVDFEDTPTSPAYRAAQEHADGFYLNVDQIDADARLVYVDTRVGDCDGCEATGVFLPYEQRVVLSDGTVDDIFRFCIDCTAAERN